MFSEIAHYQYHHFPQSSYSFYNNALEPTPPIVSENPLLGRQVSPGQNASFRQRIERPRQHARPLRNTAALPQQLPNQRPYVSNSESSEHMLRRKTPNGTLAAGYDGSPVEWTERPHAMKHHLVPTTNPLVHAHKPTGGLKDQLPRHHEQSLESRVGEQLHIKPQSTALPREHYQHGSVMGDTRTKQGWRPSNVPPVGLDSVLDQSSVHHHVWNPAGNQHVPTVLQPMWPPCLGPTSVQRPGPYGPYWPDGAFEPYRPAPLQDPRFHDQFPEACTDCSAQLLPAVDHHGQWLQAHSDSQYPCIADHSLPSIPRLASDRNEPTFPNIVLVCLSERNPTISSGVATTPQSQFGEFLAYRSKPSVWENQGSGISNETCNNLRSSASCLSLPLVATQDTALTKSNAHFKEKILVWAHQIYMNLLGSVEQARRNSMLERQGGNRRLKPSFFPRSPRRPYPFWSNSNSRESGPHRHMKARAQVPSNVSSEDSDHGLGAQKNCTHSPDHALTSQPHSTQSSMLANRYSRYKWPSRAETLGSHQTPSQASYVPYQLTSDSHSSSPSVAAVYALEMLGRLCEESGFEWTDGTLLTGCLAYGLGDFNKAMKWYLKVLQRDPNNVEAMSNLAAALHALHRREDAEHYWFRSVKLRPSYFEAVEHLIGLLHESHRGQEAVKVIEYVEHALRTDVITEPRYLNLERNTHEVQLPTQQVAGSTIRTGNIDIGSSGYGIPASDNGRMLALIHGKGNMLYQTGDTAGAAQAFEDAILIGAGSRQLGIRGLINEILDVFSGNSHVGSVSIQGAYGTDEPILLTPSMALETSRLVFPPHGQLPGLNKVPDGFCQRAAVSIVSNSLLSLAKIYQDGMSACGAAATAPRATSGVQEILALYYLSLSLQPSPSTANNVGILLASVQQSSRSKIDVKESNVQSGSIPGVIPGSGIALALAYYDYGLKLDTRHAHLYTNLGSLFKDIGHLQAAVKMYEKAVECDGTFDIALANLANAVKDQGKVSDAIVYYKRAVTSNPDFAEAVCGLANALNSVCNWGGRGGVRHLGSSQDRWHVDGRGDLYDSKESVNRNRGWIERVVAIVEKQLQDGESWGRGVLHSVGIENMLQQIRPTRLRHIDGEKVQALLQGALEDWAGNQWEGAKVVRLIERATKNLVRQIYLHQHIKRTPVPSSCRVRPQLPTALAIPSAPTVLPFHTFTCPLSAKQIRKISQRNGLRVSCSTLRAPWIPAHVYAPPAPPNPHLNVGYISSDFNNHPLAHLMQSVFGLHDRDRVKAFCYATTISDGSVHRLQIEREAPVFYDASSWSIDRLVNQVVDDGIHILVNLNGYTRGARNEVFAARPSPVQMSFMGFAGTLGAEWCDYLLADKIAIPPQTLRPWRGNVDLTDQAKDGNNDDDQDNWVYGENIIFTRDTFFCCDHRQSAPDSKEMRVDWPEEQRRRWRMRKEIFPDLSNDTVILGNFNQLYKIEPTTFRTWLRILSRIPKAVLWLLRFPDLGEENLRETALRWVGTEVASRIIFTDVAPKHQHIARARVCDLFLDTPECNAHTTAADVLWSGTPLLTLPRYDYKMCSRMAASILRGALPKDIDGDRAARELVADSDEAYEEQAVELGSGLTYPIEANMQGMGNGRLLELRKLLFESRWTSALFDTRRWVHDLECAYSEAWRRWVAGEGGDIWL